jgi:hypothetical protein
MDLTKTYPASVKTKLHGLVQIARTIDKGKAKAHGNLGEYHYNCPMDAAVFAFLGVDHEALLDVIGKAKTDAEINDYVAPFIQKKSAAEIEAWNEQCLKAAPAPGEVAPGRTDVTAWADLLDLDEKRPVPTVASV